MELGLRDRLPQAESLGSDVGQRAAGKGLISAPLLQSGFCLSDFSLFFDSGKNPCAARGAALAQLWPTGLLVACGTPSPRVQAVLAFSGGRHSLGPPPTLPGPSLRPGGGSD